VAFLVPSLALLHGARIPQLGLGTWPVRDGEAERVVAEALALGYRLVDTAHAYANERGVGKGLRASGVPREELFVTTKLNGDSHGADLARRAFATSLGRLGLDYLDLYLIHWPLPGQDLFVDAWRSLVALLEEGRVRAIGVSNFKPAHIDRLIAETGVIPDVNQIELNPRVARAGPRAYHASHGIVTESWSPLDRAGGLLACPVVTELARRHERRPAQVVLRWHIELGLVTIPKTTSPERLRENLDVFSFALAPDEVEALSALDQGESAAVDSDSTGH
jgi:2,5-diketo-D-gluconate reductase A